MADTEEPRLNTLADRIAALNKQKNFNTAEPAAPRKKPPPPQPPARPAAENRSQTPSTVDANTNGHVKGAANGNGVAKIPPPMPPRPNRSSVTPVPRGDTQTPTNGAVRPPLPSRTATASSQSSLAATPRRLSTQPSNHLSARRGSGSSEISQHSAVSALSQSQSVSSTTSYGSNGNACRKLPPANDPALPPLPPSRRELEAKAQEAAARAATPRLRTPLISANSEPVIRTTEPAPPLRPSLPPRLPSRASNNSQNTATVKAEPQQSLAPRKLPPRSTVSPRPQVNGMNGHRRDQAPAMPARTPSSSTQQDDEPPPVPVASRPSFAQIEAASARVVAKAQVTDDCLVCRDWSGPDNVAAQFPLESLPRRDPVGHLAQGLCHQFPSYTDKARAIFTWFHHNIYYDTASFFGNCVTSKTPDETILSGLAVCQGYADTYKAIANRAGLECVVVGGHGKGFGHTPLKKGESPPPPKPDGHAWNAVRIDGGEWKLLDACWGAGHICSAANLYKKEFSPQQFVSSNDRFGQRHFPQDPKHQFRNDGRTITWNEYFIGRSDGEPPIFYGNGGQEGIAEDSVEPANRQISVYSGEVVRFQFSKVCEHWTSEKDGKGKPPLLLLSIHGLDGRKDDMLPIQTNGFWHWADVNARDLGAPGQKVNVYQLTKLDGRDARGVTAKEFLSKKGRVSMAWAGVACWELV